MHVRSKVSWVLALGCALALPLGLAGTAAGGSPLGPSTPLHYTPNANFDANGAYTPAEDGFDLADVSAPTMLSKLPSGVKALAFIGTCKGADSGFRAAINAYKGGPDLFGFYLMDDPDPTGKTGPRCTASNLKAESDYVHATLPGTKTFILEMNLSTSKKPSFAGGYTPANSHVDLFGIDPYPCRTELRGCDYDMIHRYVTAAERFGIPQADIVPVYQTFGLGGWIDDGGGKYAAPSAAQLERSLDVWQDLVPRPVFDYAYSWGAQKGDQALSALPIVQVAMWLHNVLGSARSAAVHRHT